MQKQVRNCPVFLNLSLRWVWFLRDHGLARGAPFLRIPLLKIIDTFAYQILKFMKPMKNDISNPNLIMDPCVSYEMLLFLHH